jgi:dipeptidyl aminopeptidase/acylaminoacyl peptidase
MALEPPDGRRAISSITDARSGIIALWLVDMSTGVRNPLSTVKEWTGSAEWSPDGTRVAYAYQPAGVTDDVYIRDLRTSEITPLIQTADSYEHPRAWSRDGKWLLMRRWDSQVRNHLCAYSFDSQKIVPFVKVPGADVLFGKFSPDSHYVAYTSNETNRFEVWVTTFPDRTGTWQLTTEGAQVLSWGGPDGHEILVGTLSGHIAAYQVNTAGGAFSAGPPKILIPDVGYEAMYACATPDHSRILLRVNPDAHKDRNEIRLLSGWADAPRGK